MRIQLLSFLLIISIASFSQNSYTLKGIVLDQNGNIVNDAKVNFDKKTRDYTKKGTFYINVPNLSTNDITITHVAFDTLIITPKSNQKNDFFLCR